MDDEEAEEEQGPEEGNEKKKGKDNIVHILHSSRPCQLNGSFPATVDLVVANYSGG